MSQNDNPENGRPRNSRLKIADWKIASLEYVNVEIVAEGRFLGLSAGDWTVLLGGFGLSALVVLLL
jgi:hypothetical protein